MKHKADELPEHQKEDHQINLEAGKEAPYVRNYKPMSEQELDAVKKYIDEHSIWEKASSVQVRQAQQPPFF